MALTLVTAASAPLVSLPDAKRHCRVYHDDDDAYIEALVSAASAHIDAPSGWLGRAVGESTWELSLPCFPCGRIDIPLPPLRSVDGVAYTDVYGAEQTYTEFRSFRIDAPSAPGFVLPAHDGEWPETRDDDPEAVRVTFTAGYASVPKPIQHAILLLVGHWYENRENVSDLRMAEIPVAADSLLRPFQVWA